MRRRSRDWEAITTAIGAGLVALALVWFLVKLVEVTTVKTHNEERIQS